MNSFSDLPHPVYTQFQKLCEVAYNGATERQLTFSSPSRCFEHLGFMHTATELFGPRRATISHSFLHFTIQEFLAAVYISQMTVQEQMKLFVQHSSHNWSNSDATPSLRVDGEVIFNIWSFVFGLTQINGFDLSVVKEHLCSSDGDGGVVVGSGVIELLFETQDVRCLSILGDGKALYTPETFSRTTSTALAYCIVHSNCTWTLDIVSACNKVGSQHEALLSCRASRDNCIERIEGSICLQCLEKTAPCFLQGVKELDLYNSHMHADQQMSSMKKIIEQTVKLEILTLRVDPAVISEDVTPMLKSSKLAVVIRALGGLYALKEVSLQEYHIGVLEACALKEMFLTMQNQALRTVSLSECNIDDESVQQLAEGLCHNKTIKELDISHNNFQDMGMVAMAVALCNNRTIKHLDVSYNPFGNDGAIAVAEMLKTNTTLVTLIMSQWPSETMLSPEGLVALLESLDHNQELHTLRLVLHDGIHYREVLDLPVYHRNKYRFKLS